MILIINEHDSQIQLNLNNFFKKKILDIFLSLHDLQS
jgi:hypothetical protein